MENTDTFELTKATPRDQLRMVHYIDFEENWQCDNSTALNTDLT